MHRLLFCATLVAALALPAQTRAADSITPAEAAKHVGEAATVCGTVASAKFAATSRRQPTFLNLDRPYPQQIFTVVIWGADRPKFTPAPEALRGKRVCVTGTIQTYQGKPEIIITEPSALHEDGGATSESTPPPFGEAIALQ